MRQAEPIAIIGMAGRFPQAPDIDAFWALLREGRDVMERVPEAMIDSRRDARGVLPANYVPMGALLENTEYFDCALFGLTQREAMMIDPQQRLFVAEAFAAAEDAGYDISALGRRVAVYAGAGPSRHALDALEAFGHDSATLFEVIATGIDKPMAMRVSHLFDLRGESLYVYAACATSLVAIDLAMNALGTGRADAAIAGAACLYLPQMEGYDYVEGAVRSSDGHCRAFDAAADGTVWGPGVGVVVLKRLADALRDGDRVRAVLLGSSVNNDGAAKASFAAPSVSGQTDVVATALARAGIQPQDIDFVEAHGTGTRIGDPMEVASLNAVFGAGRGPGSCVLGSVKTNLGHLDPAAGVAGLIKTVLALENDFIPATVHFTRPNPAIDFAAGPFVVDGRGRPWPRGARRRRAGVNSFGVGGTNAHVVVEEAPPLPTRPASPRHRHIVTLSARTETALNTARAELCRHLSARPDLDLRDVAFTRNAGRRAFRFRQSAVAADLADLPAAFARAPVEKAVPRPPRIAFVFPGQGSQAVGMGAALYAEEPVYRDAFDRCAASLEPALGRDIRDIVFPEPGEEAAAEDLLRRTDLQQPILFCVSWSMAELFAAFGVEPTTWIGHSVGEFVAAAQAGTMTPEAALRILCARGAAIQACPPGQMLACAVTPARLASLLPPGADLAAINAPGASVAAGSDAAIAALVLALDAHGVRHTPLATSHAFHSRLVAAAAGPVADAVAAETLSAPRRPWASTVTGRRVTDAEATTAAFWAGQVGSPVRFAEAVGCALAEGVELFVELGGRSVLAGAIGAIAYEAGRGDATVLSPMRDEDGVLATLGALWRKGVSVDWGRVHGADGARRIALPATPQEGVWVALTRPDASPRPARAPHQGSLTSDPASTLPSGPPVVLGPFHAPRPDAARDSRRADLAEPYVAPTPGAQSEVAEIFGRVIGVSAVGANDDLFDLGGTSLMLVHVANQVRAVFDVNLPLRDILDNPTPRGLAAVIERHRSEAVR